MKMFTSPSVTTRQTMVVTAQLQQAIHLLQLDNADLQAFLETQAAENPFVGIARPPAPAIATAPRLRADEDDWDRIGRLAGPEGLSLYAHVARQAALLDLDADERLAAAAFLDALEPSGWMTQSIAAVAMTAGVDAAVAGRTLERLQTIEPAGLFARSLAECLRLQARAEGLLSPIMAAVLDNLPLLAAADLRGLARVAQCDMDALKRVLRQIRGFNPKPGTLFDTEVPVQRPPDLIVTRGADGWRVDLNRSTLPAVIVRDDAAERMARADRKAGPWVGERLSVARWLARAVAHRNETALLVGAEVVRRQAAFLEQGPSHLRPMILREVADAVGVHESTVSRVTTGMLMQTPQGTFPLKAFFSASLAASEGGEAGSAAAVRHRVRQLIQAEDPTDPLSDDAIVRIIGAEGIVLARRTVAKYRDQLGIASSVDRRRQALLRGAA